MTFSRISIFSRFSTRVNLFKNVMGFVSELYHYLNCQFSTQLDLESRRHVNFRMLEHGYEQIFIFNLKCCSDLI
jgi:hypothetical protein